ncbi:MAG: enoyl-CoA hydratase [Acidobacteria bacterium]|nr:MAG: enoyl-CoA hydratase [Acidobacteriota bacterium]
MNSGSNHHHSHGEEQRIRETALDQTLADSFPASDPPSSLPNPDEHDALTAPSEPATANPLVMRSAHDGVLTLTLNRGDRFNPLSSDMIAALQRELDATARDESVRVVVLAGAGRGFCAGHDLKEMRAHAADAGWQRDLFDACRRMMISLTRMPQPIIGRVHGIATAAGCQLVSMCDLAVAADTAAFALPGVNIGLFCSTPAVGVVRNVGRKRAMEMLLTGSTISAATALAWGLVNRVVPAGQLDEEIGRFTDIVIARSAAAVRLGKRAFYDQIDRSIETAYDIASEAMLCNALLEDAAEGMDAFLGKRSPVWTGR